MITLGGLELSDSLVWQERYLSQRVTQTEKLTLGGAVRIQSARITSGMPITLEATQDHGWLTREQVEALKDMADDPTGVYTLQFGDASYSVVFRHSQAPAVDFIPFVPRTQDEPGDYLTGTIKLITL